MITTEYWTAQQWRRAERAYFAEREGLKAFVLIKRLMDILFASIGLILLLPILGLMALAVRFSSPGPIFFVQERLGRLGKPFRIYKFRTMVDGAVHLGAGLETFEGDPRVTPVGRFLREYHLDEFPQLWNVLRGEMSLVGPRPLLVEELETYSNWEKRRLLVPPGITAWEAIKGGLLNTAEERIELDIWYVDHWTPVLDLWIIACTIPVVLRKEGVYEKHVPNYSREA